jgi:hypothetical protein
VGRTGLRIEPGDLDQPSTHRHSLMSHSSLIMDRPGRWPGDPLTVPSTKHRHGIYRS